MNTGPDQFSVLVVHAQRCILSGMAMVFRVAVLMAWTAASVWQFTSGGLLGGAFFAALAAFALFSLLSTWSVSRRWHGRLEVSNAPTAWRTGLMAAFALLLGVTQIAGYGLQRDVSRGVLALVASTFFFVITIDVVFFRDRRREKERFDRQAQAEWLERIAPHASVPPDSP